MFAQNNFSGLSVITVNIENYYVMPLKNMVKLT